MPEYTCPECHATLDPDALARLESAECPFCGRELPESLLPSSERLGPTDSVSASSFLSSTSSATAAPSDAAALAATLPPKSRIQVVEATPDRLLLYIPAGGSRQTRSLGCIALLWNGFIGAFTGVWVVTGLEDMPMFFLVPFLGIFWLVGLFMLGFWFRMRFSRFFVLVEPNRFTLQRVLFGRKSLQMAELGPDSRAELVEAYTENDRPVYAVAVTGVDRTIKFGVGLSAEEKQWLLDQINGMLGKKAEGGPSGTCPECGATWTVEPSVAALVTTCPDCGASVVPASPDGEATRETPPEVAPETVSSRDAVRIEEADSEHLRFSFQLIPQAVARVVIAIVTCVVGLGWCGFAGWIFWNALDGGAGWAAVVAGVMLIPGVIPFIAAALIVRSQLTVDVTRDWVMCRWHAGPFGYTHRAAPETIEAITLEPAVRVTETSTGGRRIQHTGQMVCMLRSGGKNIPLTLGHDTATARLVGGLIRWQLRQFGLSLPPD